MKARAIARRCHSPPDNSIPPANFAAQKGFVACRQRLDQVVAPGRAGRLLNPGQVMEVATHPSPMFSPAVKA